MKKKKKKCNVGWHAMTSKAPHRGKGGATVQPIKSKKAILAIRRHLSEAKNVRDMALFIVGINFGLRGGDLVRLKWSDVLDKSGDLKNVVRIRESKNNNVRNIPINPKVRSVLERLQRDNEENDSGEYLFPSRKRRNGEAQPMTVIRLHQLVNEWCAAIGLEGHWGSHTLRKTFGFWCFHQGISLALLMSLFGHSSEAITKRYIGIDEEAQKEVYLKLEL